MQAINRQKLALASAALGIGAGYTTAATAQTVSNAPGNGSTSVSESSGSTATFNVAPMKLNGSVTLNGTSPKFGITGKDPSGNAVIGTIPGTIDAAAAGNDSLYVDANGMLATSRTASLPAGLTTSASGVLANGATSNFDATPSYGFVSYAGKPGITLPGKNGAAPVTIPAVPGGTGYFEGTFANGTFTLLDYGQIAGAGAAPAVPEPETWALLTLGFAGMGAALRRSRRAQQRRVVPATL